MQHPRRRPLVCSHVALIASALIVATHTASAHAGYLSHEPGQGQAGFESGEWTLLAADGEANRLSVRPAPTGLLFEDLGAGIEVLSLGGARARCAQGVPTLVACTVASPGPVIVGRGVEVTLDGQRIEADLGDGDDVAAVTGPLDAQLDGGSGDDRLLAGGGHFNLLDGGDGRDTLVGGGGQDRLTGGPGADVMDGGPGRDEVSYLFRDRGVRVDLRRRAGQGERGEGDVIVNVEDVQASLGPSRLVGNARANELSGGAFRDVISGGGGNDTISGFLGGDVLTGGPGRDRIDGEGTGLSVFPPEPPVGRDEIRAVDGERDVVDCGRGRDTAYVDRIDRVTNCERVVIGAP